MVSVSGDVNSPPVLVHLQEGMDQRIREELPEKGPVLQAFVCWIGSPEHRQLIDPDKLISGIAGGGITSYQDIATLGFLTPYWRTNSQLRDRFHEGLAWLTGRSFFGPHRTRGFEADAIAMLGVAVGAQKVDDGKLRGSLTEICRQAADECSDNDWAKCLTLTALSVLNETMLPSEVLERSPDLALALTDLEPTFFAPDELPQAAWKMILSPSTLNHPWDRLIVRSKALDKLYRHVASVNPEQASVSDVIKVLSRVGDGLRKWTWEETAKTRSSEPETWNVQHEYHVQNLLWAILRPIFPDLRDEEWLESIGHRKPRADLAIPSLKLVIEVKFIRSPSDFSSKIREVAAAASMYVKEGSRFTQLVAFVWDDSRSTEEHEELRSGLSGLERVTDAVVVARPGKWE